MTVNLIMGLLPLLGEDVVVRHNCFLNLICGRQGLCTTLLSVHLNLMDLGPMGSPFTFGIIDLKRMDQGYQKGPTSISFTLDSNFNIQGRKRSTIAVP